MRVSAGTPAHWAQKALDAKLYKDVGQLREALLYVTREPTGATVSVLQDEQGELHGVCLIAADGCVQVLVRNIHRGQRWGEKLVQLAGILTPLAREDLYAYQGARFSASVRFWDKCGIRVRDHLSEFGMTEQEANDLVRHGRVLIHRPSDSFGWRLFTALYLARLYEPQSSDQGDGIKAQLNAFVEFMESPIDTEPGPLFDYLLFHTNASFFSCATVCIEPQNKVLLQLYVHPDYRRQGFGQQIIDTVKQVYPGHEIWGYHTDTSRSLLLSNGIKNLRKELDEYPEFAGVAAAV